MTNERMMEIINDLKRQKGILRKANAELKEEVKQLQAIVRETSKAMVSMCEVALTERGKTFEEAIEVVKRALSEDPFLEKAIVEALEKAKAFRR